MCSFDINFYNSYTLISEGTIANTCTYFDIFSNLYLGDAILLHNSLCFDKISYCNTVYKINFILTNYDSSDELIVYILRKIVCLNKNTIYFFCQKINVISYENHLASYKISKSMTDDYVFKPINYFNDNPIHLYEIPMYPNEFVIRLKQKK